MNSPEFALVFKMRVSRERTPCSVIRKTPSKKSYNWWTFFDVQKYLIFLIFKYTSIGHFTVGVCIAVKRLKHPESTGKRGDYYLALFIKGYDKKSGPLIRNK